MFKMLRDYLEVDDVYVGNVIDYLGDKLFLVKTEGEVTTFIKDDFAEGLTKGLDDTVVFGRQRWRVDILPDSWGTTFTTSRNIEFILTDFKSLKNEYTSKEETYMSMFGTTEFVEDHTQDKTKIDKFIYNSF